MKKVIMLLAVFLVPIICWLLGAFISAELNPMLWEEFSRSLLVLLSTILLLFTECFIMEHF